LAPKKKSGFVAKGESLTVRLEPKLKWGIELLARKHRRNMSSVLEWIIINAINGNEGLNVVQNSTTTSLLDLAWDTDEADRIVKLAIYYPTLLTYEEEVVWKLIKENGYFWSEKNKNKRNDLNFLKFEKVRKHWENLTKVALGKASIDILPKVDRT